MKGPAAETETYPMVNGTAGVEGASRDAASGRDGGVAAPRSMTGFALARGEMPGWDWVWDLRSVNGRGLDLRLRLPDWVDGLEPRVRSALQGRISRGSVTCALRLNRRGSGGEAALDAGGAGADHGGAGRSRGRGRARRGDAAAFHCRRCAGAARA